VVLYYGEPTEEHLCVDVDSVPRSCNFHSMEDHEHVGFLLSAHFGSNVTVVVHHHALACDRHDGHRTVVDQLLSQVEGEGVLCGITCKENGLVLDLG